MAVAVVWRDPITGKTGYTALSTDTLPNAAAGSQAWITDQPGTIKQYDGTAWVQTHSGGAALVSVASSALKPYGNALQDDLWGDEVNKAALVNGAGAGPDYFYVDMRQYGRAALVALMSGTTIQHSATIDWSPSGDAAGGWHSSTSLWSAQTGNQGAAITILDNFARITLSQGAGTAESVYAYVVGRELA